MLLKQWFGGIFYLRNDKHIIISSIWMIGALASFCLMVVGERQLSGDIPTFQILFYRSIIGLTVVSVIILFTWQSSLFLTVRLGLHSIRNVFHFSAQYGWFLGLGLLPLAEVFAFEFTVPFWTVLIACCFLKERLTVIKFTSILLGLLGVIVIVSLGKEIVNYASLIVLAAAVFFAVSHASTKSLLSSEDPLAIKFSCA